MATDTPSGPHWSEDERPTDRMTPQARSAVLVANWAACTPERQRRLEKYAAALAALRKDDEKK